jgi:hypothetical protein
VKRQKKGEDLGEDEKSTIKDMVFENSYSHKL